MKDRERNTAEKFKILDKVQKFESELLKIDGVTEVDFDLSGFYDDMNYVIFLTKYSIPVNAEGYFEKRKKLIRNVVETARNNGLKRTGSSIEDYGEHFYFVTECDDSWKRA